MSQKPYVIDNMISAKSIAARIEQLAEEIEQEFADTDKLVVVGLLRGSFVFIADLVREINLPIEVDFLEVSSYGDAYGKLTRGAYFKGSARYHRES
jgi:hypoxanthine phosphoribosyltransferase